MNFFGKNSMIKLMELIKSAFSSFVNTVIEDDANNARKTGFYHLYGTALNNPVSGAGGTLIVMHPKSYKDGEYIRQIAVMNTSDVPNNFRVFVRMTDGGGIWGEWVQFASKSMVDSKVNKAGDTITGSLILSKTTDASGTADNGPALIVGGTRTTAHIEMDGNEIMAKSNGTTPANLYLNGDGGQVYINGKKPVVGSSVGSATKPVYIDADGNATDCSEDFTSYAKKSSGNTFSANQYIDRANGTATTEGTSLITLGNNIAKGTDKNSYGYVRLYGHQSYYANILPAATMAANYSVTLPSKAGILLADTTPFTWGSPAISVTSGVYNGSNFNFAKFGAVKMIKFFLKVASGANTTWVKVGTYPDGFSSTGTQYYTFPIATNIFGKLRIEESGNVSVRLLAAYSGSGVDVDSIMVYF